MCAQQLVPDSFPALLSLPADVLAEAAKGMPEAAKQQLVAFARQGSAGTVPGATLAALDQLVAQGQHPLAAKEGPQQLDGSAV